MNDNLSSDSNLRTAAKLKGYTGAAVLTFVLYWLFWLPGFIVNWMYYLEAKRMEKIAGESLPGVGCLFTMLALNGLVIVGTVIVVIMVFGVASGVG